MKRQDFESLIGANFVPKSLVKIAEVTGSCLFEVIIDLRSGSWLPDPQANLALNKEWGDANPNLSPSPGQMRCG